MDLMASTLLSRKIELSFCFFHLATEKNDLKESISSLSLIAFLLADI